LSREEAASRQIEAAIDALESDDFDIALTLAGAAEGMIVRERRHMFAWLRDHPGAAERFTKDWVSVLNLERDWLKHGGQQNTKIECASAAFMIARAMSKLEMWTPKMDAFKAWLLSNLDNFSTDRGTDR
jgi:hypothetical protein